MTSTTAKNAAFQLTSADIKRGQLMDKRFEYRPAENAKNNPSPALSWCGAPAGTKSFALTVYDPDAPTISGFWHWLVINLPATLSALPRGADIAALGGFEMRNDYGKAYFCGAHPPIGDDMHRYQFTLWALAEETLDFTIETSAARLGF